MRISFDVDRHTTYVEVEGGLYRKVEKWTVIFVVDPPQSYGDALENVGVGESAHEAFESIFTKLTILGEPVIS